MVVLTRKSPGGCLAWLTKNVPQTRTEVFYKLQRGQNVEQVVLQLPPACVSFLQLWLFCLPLFQRKPYQQTSQNARPSLRSSLGAPNRTPSPSPLTTDRTFTYT